MFLVFHFFVVIPRHNLGNSQVSVYRTIGPTLVITPYVAETFSNVSIYIRGSHVNYDTRCVITCLRLSVQVIHLQSNGLVRGLKFPI